MGKLKGLIEKTESNIINGFYGKSGDKFLTLREFCEQNDVSYMTAVRLYEQLKKKDLIFLYGNNYYILNGIHDGKSELYKAIKHKNSKKIRIGLSIRDISNQFFMALSKEIAQLLKNSNIELIILTSNNDTKYEKKILMDFLHLGCYGVFSFVGYNERDLYNFYSRYPLPFVLIGRKVEDIKTDFISTDNYESGLQVAKYLVNCGYQKFGYIGLKNLNERNDLRFLGYREGLKMLNQDITPKLYLRINIEDNLHSIHNALVREKSPIGMFCYHDLLAVKLLNFCSYNNIHVPKSVGIIGYDDLPITVAVNPSITTFSCNYKAFAKLAVDIMLEKIKAPHNINKLHTIQTSMIIRKSTCNLRIPEE